MVVFCSARGSASAPVARVPAILRAVLTMLLGDATVIPCPLSFLTVAIINPSASDTSLFAMSIIAHNGPDHKTLSWA